MPRKFGLTLSTSTFLYVMPGELVDLGYAKQMGGDLRKFDSGQNSAMAGFMRDVLNAVSGSDVEALECYHSLAYEHEPLLEILLDRPPVEYWSVHGPFGRNMDISSPDSTARRTGIDALVDAGKMAAALGAGLVVCHPGITAVSGPAARETGIRHSTESLREVADRLGKMGLVAAVEPLPRGEIGNSLDDVLRIVDAIDLPNVGINFDVNHLYPPEAVPGLIRRALGRIVSVHISDQDGIERHWLPFDGKLDWAEVLRALDDADYTGPLVYETHIKTAKNCGEVVSTVCENYRRLAGLVGASARSV